jgi:cytochrome c
MKRTLFATALLVAALGSAVPALAGDAALGKSVFAAQCAMCHTVTKGIVGRKAGSLANYAYSKGMKTAGFSWTDDKLRAYLPAPANLVPGTKMAFAGVKNPAQLDNLVTYLETLK